MAKIISIHEYILKPEADESKFEQAIRVAIDNHLLELPGLVEYKFVKGVKGAREGQYAAIWIYQDKESWENLWGTPENHRTKDDYPENWQKWEHKVLAPFLIEDPDRITYTAYKEII